MFNSDIINRVLPYLKLMRLHRPFGILPLLFPCWWGLALEPSISVTYMILFTLGAIIMRGAGCVINDVWDMKIDRQVERTKTRPLAQGDLTTKQALMFLGLLLMLGLTILLCFPMRVVIWGAGSLILVVLYPLMKRITYWPQLILGFTFNWGVLLAGLINHETLGAPWILFYVAGILWTLGYDTIYAHQDKVDDAIIGVKSTALLFRDKTKSYLTFFYGGAFLLMVLGAYLASKGALFYIGMYITAMHFAWQIITLDLDNPKNCHARFAANAMLGGWIFVCLWAG